MSAPAIPLSGSLLGAAVSWRRALHRAPELGFSEIETAAFVCDKLKQAGLEVHGDIGGTGVVGVLKVGSRKRAIGFRAELDALRVFESSGCEHASERPGVMHACGHDGHMAMLLAAAAQLGAHPAIDGTIYFIFQPAEEFGQGAQAMIADGLFQRFPMDAIYALHNWPALQVGKFGLRAGAMMASEDNFEIKITGRGGHAASPHLLIDPVVASAEIVLALQSIVSRGIDPRESAVVSVTEILTDGVRNVVPSEIRIKGDCRALSLSVQEKIQRRMRAIVRGVCEAHGMVGEVLYENSFIPTINAAEPTELASMAAGHVVGAENVGDQCTPAMASDDFAQMCLETPGCYVLLGQGEGSEPITLHNSKYDFNDKVISVGVRFWLALAGVALGTGTSPRDQEAHAPAQDREESI